MGWPAVPVPVAIGAIALLCHGRQRKGRRQDAFLGFGAQSLDALSGAELKDLVRVVYERPGYDARATPRARYHGADIAIKKGGRTMAAQAKRYGKDVGIKAVQAHSSMNRCGATEARGRDGERLYEAGGQGRKRERRHPSRKAAARGLGCSRPRRDAKGAGA